MSRINWWRVLAAMIVAIVLWFIGQQADARGRVDTGTLYLPGPCASGEMQIQIEGASGWVRVYPHPLGPGECLTGYNVALAPATRSCCTIEGDALLCSEKGAIIVDGENEKEICTKKFNWKGEEIPIPTPIPTGTPTPSVPIPSPSPVPTVTPVPVLFNPSIHCNCEAALICKPRAEWDDKVVCLCENPDGSLY